MIREVNINLSSLDTFVARKEFTASKKEGLMIIDGTNVVLYSGDTIYGKYGPGEYILDKESFQKSFTIFFYKQDLILSSFSYKDYEFICTSKVKDFVALFDIPHNAKSLIKEKDVSKYIFSLIEQKNVSKEEIKPYLEYELLKVGLFSEVTLLEVKNDI